MNYATLFETIKGYVENDFPNTSWTDSAGTGTVTLTSTEQINTFIKQAEQRVFNMVQLLDLRKNVTGSCTTANKYVTVPTDWLATFSLAVIDSLGNYEYLLNKDVNYIRQAFPNPSESGIPTHYAYFDQNSFIVGPTPNDNYAVELHYFYYPTSIVDAGTSWLGDNFDSVLLYGSLLEAYTFMKGEPDIIQGYQKRYDEALAMLKMLGEGKNRQDMYRSGQARYPVR
jgi:hypothetical protein